VEGTPGQSPALGVLDMHTEMTQEKRLAQVSGTCEFAQATAAGYEIHMGVSSGPALARPAFRIDGRAEGAMSADGQVMGSYLHGMFDTPQACAALLAWAGLNSETTVDTAQLREKSLDQIAEAARPLYDALAALRG
jgi:adenosylcobyric acid synthase